jgi:hypothetical protein
MRFASRFSVFARIFPSAFLPMIFNANGSSNISGWSTIWCCARHRAARWAVLLGLLFSIAASSYFVAMIRRQVQGGVTAKSKCGARLPTCST